MKRLSFGPAAAFAVLIALIGVLLAAPAAQPGVGPMVLWNQNDAHFGLYDGLISQTPYDQVADDFVVPAGESWTIDEIDAPGYGQPPDTSGCTAGESVLVTVYADDGGSPGTQVSQVAVHPADGLVQDGCSFTIPVEISLSGGHYWLSVQADGGRWFWLFRSGSYGDPAAFKPAQAVSWVNAGQYNGWLAWDLDMMFRLVGTGASADTLTPTDGATLFTTVGKPLSDVVLGTFTDSNPGAVATHDLTAEVCWNDDGGPSPSDCESGTVARVAGTSGSFQVSGSHTFAAAGSYTVTTTVSDTKGDHATISTSVQVVEITMTNGGPLSAVVGQPLSDATLGTFTYSDTSVVAGDFVWVVVCWNDDPTSGETSNCEPATVTGGDGSFAVIGSHTFVAPGTYTVESGALDSHFNGAVFTTTVEVVDAVVSPLTPSDGEPWSAVEGKPVKGTLGTFTDADTGTPARGFGAQVCWNDGGSSPGDCDDAKVTGRNGSFTVTGGHTFADEGSYTAVTTVTDAGGHTATINTDVTVADAPLKIAGKVKATIGRGPGAPVTVVAGFKDANRAATIDDYSATISWGDGTADTTGLIVAGRGGWTVTGSHTYAETHHVQYAVEVTIQDIGGASVGAGTTVKFR